MEEMVVDDEETVRDNEVIEEDGAVDDCAAMLELEAEEVVEDETVEGDGAVDDCAEVLELKLELALELELEDEMEDCGVEGIVAEIGVWDKTDDVKVEKVDLLVVSRPELPVKVVLGSVDGVNARVVLGCVAVREAPEASGWPLVGSTVCDCWLEESDRVVGELEVGIEVLDTSA
ncbi:MAG: hypothetical protein LQ346_002510 [Caloplaca aetnensis]|nr:MAG: hypothetical protein LQ346_002510 [Caloplaca aetnensis]